MPLLNPLRKTLKSLLPETLLKKVRPFGHSTESLLYHYITGRPSDSLIVIGVTGTKGKTSTCHITYQLLNALGAKCGLVSTAVIDDGTGEKLNKYRMTQVSGALTHKILATMKKNGCKYAVIEVSSEGLAQGRHKGINFDIAVFTNLTPDHIEAHGSFENYKAAKGILFKELSTHSITPAKKQINPEVAKTIIANLDSEHGLYYLNFKSDKHVTYAVNNSSANIVATNITSSIQSSQFRVSHLRQGFGGQASFEFRVGLPGEFNIYNVLAAIAVCKSLGFCLEYMQSASGKLRTIPGRMEILQTTPFTVVVDYAHEKASMTALFSTIKNWPHNRIIQVFGATGGVRDKSRRKDLGMLAGQFADIVIVTDEDPFDEDPKKIIRDIVNAVVTTGKKEDGKDLFSNPNRREAIAKALSLAEKGDMVLITGKGAEQKIARANGTYEDWDDRVVAREELEKIK